MYRNKVKNIVFIVLLLSLFNNTKVLSGPDDIKLTVVRHQKFIYPLSRVFSVTVKIKNTSKDSSYILYNIGDVGTLDPNDTIIKNQFQGMDIHIENKQKESVKRVWTTYLRHRRNHPSLRIIKRNERMESKYETVMLRPKRKLKITYKIIIHKIPFEIGSYYFNMNLISGYRTIAQDSSKWREDEKTNNAKVFFGRVQTPYYRIYSFKKD